MAEKGKESFLLYTSYKEKFEDLTDEQFGKLIRLMIDYAIDGEVAKIEDKQLRLAFKVVKVEMDVNAEKYGKACKKKQEAQERRWKKEAENKKEVEHYRELYKSIDNYSKNSDNDNENENENENDNGNIINDILKTNIKSTHTSDCKAVASAFNDICTSFPKIQSLTDTRKRLIKKLLEKYSFDEIREVFLKAERADFLKGNGEKGWKANFDWIVKEGNFVKIKEGNYDGTITTKRKEDCINDRSEYGDDFGLYESFASALDDAKK